MTVTPDAAPVVLAERYRLEERIGAGSMGAVWRATDELLNRTVAVKQLLLHPGAPNFDREGYEEAKQRILREGRLAARLQHPHTISVFDVVLHGDAPWLVMEYMPSRTLNALLRTEAPLEPRRVARIGWQIADGLSAAHAAGIVHRDIKPANVLIGTDAMVKITDFGVSRAADDVQLTRTGLIAGTPAFLAPEVARGQTPTPASDVFALGSTLYTAVEGEPPFGLDDNAYALLYKVGAGNVRPPERAGPLTEALMSMLRKEPAERPTAAEARDALAAVATARSTARSGARSGARSKAPAAVAPKPRSWTDLEKTGGDTKVDVVAEDVPELASAGTAVARATPLTRKRLPLLTWVLLAVVVVVAAVAAALATPWGSALVGVPANPPSSVATGEERPPTGQPSPAEMEDFIRRYYALLPNQPDAAWAMLGESARRASGDEASYRGFYHTIASIGFAEGPKAVDDRTVRATLRFQLKDGGTSVERYTFTVERAPNGQLEMTSFDR